VLAASYDLPIGRGRLLNLESRVADSILGGWRVNGIYSYQTGAPIQWMNGSTNNPGDYPLCAVATVSGACPNGANGVPQGTTAFPITSLNNRQTVGSTFDTSQFVTASGQQFQFHVRTLPSTFSSLRTDGTIYVRPGSYREVVEVATSHVRMIGDPGNPASVVIVYDKSAGTAGGTFNSSTFAVTADDFVADGITFENDFSKKNPRATQGTQAVALAVRGDRAVFRHVRVIGAQDSLFGAAKSCESDTGPCVPARQYFEDCYVEGYVDFIFGDAKAYFHNCEIHAIAHKTVYLTAQSKRYPDQDSGYIFDACKVTAAPGATEIYLGRPWHRFSTVVFLNSELPAAVVPAGWHEWHTGETNSLETSFYAECQSTGPGANPSGRDPHSHQLSQAEVQKFVASQFLRGQDGWDPLAVR
jgi:pectin methylesterase-like acyl-CoA thioesterase